MKQYNNPYILLNFDEFVLRSPKEIRDYINKCEKTPQSKCWHPEAPDEKVPHNVKAHTRIVFNRAKRTGDINLMLAAFFHDLGKADTTTPHATIPGNWSAHGHDKVSAYLVKKYAYWIELFDAKPELVHYIVKQHMRIQQIDEMRPFKREEFMQHKFFPYVKKFTEFDDMTKDYANDLD